MLPTLLQPKAAVKSDGDGVLYSIQREEYQLLWVDVCKIENYINYNHIKRYYTRLATIVEAACRSRPSLPSITGSKTGPPPVDTSWQDSKT